MMLEPRASCSITEKFFTPHEVQESKKTQANFQLTDLSNLRVFHKGETFKYGGDLNNLVVTGLYKCVYISMWTCFKYMFGLVPVQVWLIREGSFLW